MQDIIKIVDSMELLGFLKFNGTDCRFVSMVSKTPVKKIKVGNPFPGLMKISKKVGIINANYNTSVCRRIADKLGVTLGNVEYENGEVWYEHLKTTDGKNLPVVKNKKKDDGKFYLQFFPHTAKSHYALPDGTLVPDEKVKPFLYKESERPDYKPCVIAIELGNICELKASGVVIQNSDYEEAEQIISQA